MRFVLKHIQTHTSNVSVNQTMYHFLLIDNSPASYINNDSLFS